MNDLQKLFDQNIESFYGTFKPQKIAIAVSGGPDSFALLLLAHHWAKEKAINIVALTIDHQLRKESLAEAQYVAKICDEHNIDHHILPWHREKDTSSMHDSARKARYYLLTQYCLANNIDSILTAHHADDEIENFFIRLSKASGLIGLSSSNINYYNNIKILRPIFNAYKKELKHYISLHNLTPCEDPSNQDPKYQRSNIRKWIGDMPVELEPDLFKSRILQSLGHLKNSAEELKRIFIKALAERVIILPNGSAVYNFKPYSNEIETLILAHLVTTISGAYDTPRAESIERLLNKFLTNESCKATLHGCALEKTTLKSLFTAVLGKSSLTPPLCRQQQSGTIGGARILIIRI